MFDFYMLTGYGQLINSFFFLRVGTPSYTSLPKKSCHLYTCPKDVLLSLPELVAVGIPKVVCGLVVDRIHSYISHPISV